MERTNWERAAAVTVTLLGAVIGIYWVGRYVLLLFLPFLAALALSLLTRPLVVRLSCRMGEKWAAVTVTALALLFLGLLGYLLCSRLVVEIRGLILAFTQAGAGTDGPIAELAALVRVLRQSLPLPAGGLLAQADGLLSQQLTNAVARLSQWVTDLAVGLLGAMPSVLLFLLVSIISCFYFAVEHRTVCRVIGGLIPARFRGRDWRHRAGVALRRYLRAYVLLFLLTLAELLIGFLLLRVHYAFLLALVTAVLDILPVLGVGTVLVPYAVLSLVTGHTGLGVGLLILYGVITVVRQVVEPRLVGKSLGLHPILMLVSFYAGFKLFGVAGVFVGPLLTMLIKGLWSRTEITE